MPWRPFLGSITIGSLWRTPMRWSSPLGPNPFGGISGIGRSGSASSGPPYGAVVGRPQWDDSLQRGSGFLRRGSTHFSRPHQRRRQAGRDRRWRMEPHLEPARACSGPSSLVSGASLPSAAEKSSVRRLLWSQPWVDSSRAAKRPWHFLGQLWDDSNGGRTGCSQRSTSPRCSQEFRSCEDRGQAHSVVGRLGNLFRGSRSIRGHMMIADPMWSFIS